MFGQMSRAAGPIVVASVAAMTTYRFVWIALAICAIGSGVALWLLSRAVEDLAKAPVGA